MDFIFKIQQTVSQLQPLITVINITVNHLQVNVKFADLGITQLEIVVVREKTVLI